jgi:hypothetical protein
MYAVWEKNRELSRHPARAGGAGWVIALCGCGFPAAKVVVDIRKSADTETIKCFMGSPVNTDASFGGLNVEHLKTD